MNSLLCVAALMVLQQGPAGLQERERHPLAPSLPRLTREEEQKVDGIIERFILYDIGKLQGAEGKKALDDFNRLGPESTFQLIDGLNRAANLEASCPAIVIAKKLAGVFLTTKDVELLSFARENIGAGVTAKRHLNALQDLKFQCQLRKAALQRSAAASGGNPAGKAVASMSLAELEKAAGKERGTRLQAVLAEAEKRSGAQAVAVLILGIRNPETDTAWRSQALLAKNLARQSAELLRTLLQHERREVRIAAAGAVGSRKLPFGGELISMLQEQDDETSQAARRALAQLSGGMDFGPEVQADAEARMAAIERWRDWWSRTK